MGHRGVRDGVRQVTTIVGVMGPAGSGKSTVADYLVERYGAVKYTLAAPLKEIARDVLEFTHEQLYGSQAQKETTDPRYGFTPRWFLQRLGTEGLRKHFGEDVWVDLMLARIRRDQPILAVCDDCRFMNEACKILAFNDGLGGRGHVWRLSGQHRASADAGTHQSEQEWDRAPYDYAIAPAGFGVEHLRKCVDDAAAHYCIFPKRPELPL